MKGKTEEESKIQGAWEEMMQILSKEGCHSEQLYTVGTGKHPRLLMLPVGGTWVWNESEG